MGSIHNTDIDCGGYSDYTSLSTVMEIGTGYTITVTNSQPFSSDECGIWVDWNQDMDFYDPNEQITVSGSLGVGPYTATITPPADANLGNTRMRILISQSGDIQPCGPSDPDEVEDYTINVTESVPQYCSASSQFCAPYINDFRLKGINNGSSDCNAGGYSNFTDLQTSLMLRDTYAVSIGFRQLDYKVGLWVDWNQDMDFDDPGETIQTIDSGPYSSEATLIVPPAAVLGNTRLRVRANYLWPPDFLPPVPCGQMDTGETEDYTINIVSDQNEYCDAGAGFFSDSYIYRFRIKTIDNSTGTGGSSYSDYTSITTQLEKDTAYPFIIDTGSGGPSTAVWVDWNDDKDFDDPCESIPLDYLVYNEPPYSNSTLWTGTRYEKLNIPDWVSYGPKRVRIRTSDSNPCGYDKYSGEVEDYTIIISENGTTVEESYGGGKGTEQEPFLIYTAEQLNRIGINNYQWESHFKLMADIDMSELGQEPCNIIGNEIFAFEGVFDGNCHAISNFTYQSDNKHRVGLFGRTAGNSLIKNLGLIAPDVNSPGGNAIGGFVGILESGTVSNCYVKGGRISGNKAIGAIAGGHHGTIEYCYAATSVSGSSSFGAIAGLSSGSVTYDSFWDVNEALPATTSAGGTGKTTAQMMQEATFTNWDFIDIWKICEGKDYPKLQWKKYGGGNGTQENPYLISTACQMQLIGADPNDWNKHFKLTVDIDLGDFNGTEFNIIGTFGNPFRGVFDGDGHTISNFTYESYDADYIGLFGSVVGSNALIKDLTLNNPNVDVGKGQKVSSLVAFLRDGIILDCGTDGGSISGWYDTGGLVGYNLDGQLLNCYVTGTVAGDIYVGGLVGANFGEILNCYSTASVEGTLIGVGGIVGYNYIGPILNCYAAGTVGGDESVGGLVGESYSGSYTKCFWDSDVNPDVNGVGNTTNPNVIAKTTAEVKMESTFADAGWDFTTPIWKICEGTNYPKLAWQAILPGDLVCPDGIDMKDYAVLADQWQRDVLASDVAPDGGDGIVNFMDWAIVANGWPDTTDIDDVATFAAQWLQPSAYCADIAPDGGDGVVDWFDLKELAEDWLEGSFD